MLFVPSNAFSIEKDRREKWPEIRGATARYDGKEHKVYFDPFNPAHILVFDSCWIIRRDTEEVISPNCAFELEGDTLYFDKTWRDPKGYVLGVEWGDAKMDNISFFSLIFRRPEFKKDSVSFWDGSQWIFINGLPLIETK